MQMCGECKEEALEFVDVLFSMSTKEAHNTCGQKDSQKSIISIENESSEIIDH